jgi:tetratricopeptide (TPR) repeat protein
MKKTFILLCLPFALFLADSSHASVAYENLTQRIENDRRDIGAYISLITMQCENADFGEAISYQKKALRYAKQKSKIMTLRTLGIEANAGLGKLKKAETEYQRALNIDGAQKNVRLHTAMSRAYLTFRKLEQAKQAVAQALIADPKNIQTYRLLSQLFTIEKAFFISQSTIAFEASVSREQVADLLINEVNLNRFLDPTQGNIQGMRSDQGLTDYADSPFQNEIRLAHKLGIRSFRIQNGAFRPKENFSFEDLALLAEDTLSLTTGINKTLYFGLPSPYSDLTADDTAFNAFLNAITRGVIRGDINGRIRPNESVSGAETVLALQFLKQLVIAQDVTRI